MRNVDSTEMYMYMKICQNTEDSSHFIIHDHRQLALMYLWVKARHNIFNVYTMIPAK